MGNLKLEAAGDDLVRSVSYGLVSVVIPAHNVARWLPATLDSVRQQTYEELEILVIDDGSSDGTAVIAAATAAADLRVRLFRQPQQGVAAARNRGIAEARGELIAPVDADDLWHPDKIRLQVEALRRAGPEVALIYTLYRKIDEEGRIVADGGCRSHPDGDVYAHLMLTNIVGHASSPLIRRSCLLAVGGFDSSLRAAGAEGCEDLDLYLALAERWRFGVVPQFLVGYRQRASSMSRDRARMARSRAFVLARARERRPELPALLFRWAESRFTYSASAACWAAGQPRKAARLILRAIRFDPIGFGFRLLVALRRQLLRRGRRAAGGAAPSRLPAFHDVAPDVVVGPPSPLSWPERRQRALARISQCAQTARITSVNRHRILTDPGLALNSVPSADGEKVNSG